MSLHEIPFSPPYDDDRGREIRSSLILRITKRNTNFGQLWTGISCIVMASMGKISVEKCIRRHQFSHRGRQGSNLVWQGRGRLILKTSGRLTIIIPGWHNYITPVAAAETLLIAPPNHPSDRTEKRRDGRKLPLPSLAVSSPAFTAKKPVQSTGFYL